MGQMASMFNERQQGNLSSTLEVNLRRDGKEHCKYITLRRDKTVEKLVQVSGGKNSAINGENSVENDESSAGISGSSAKNAENSAGTT